MGEWTDWKAFPVPDEDGYLYAPFGPGVYELMNGKTKEKVLYGMGKNVAARMCSLLSAPDGCGTRNNNEKREYVRKHIKDILYRTKSCPTREQALAGEALLRQTGGPYLFRD